MDNNKFIDELVEVPYSQIQLNKPIPAPVISIDLSTQNKTYWMNKSNTLLSDYSYGETLGAYGNTSITTTILFDRIFKLINNYIINECKKQNTSSENLKDHFKALESILALLAKEVDSKQIKNYNPLSIIACLHGFVTGYMDSQTKGK